MFTHKCMHKHHVKCPDSKCWEIRSKSIIFILLCCLVVMFWQVFFFFFFFFFFVLCPKFHGLKELPARYWFLAIKTRGQLIVDSHYSASESLFQAKS